MTSTPKSAKHAQENEISSSLAGGHKASFKSTTKLARRARSFKDDFLGKISQMRSPVGPGARAHSPKNHNHNHNVKRDEGKHLGSKGPVNELEGWFKQIQIALKHFKDVVAKQKLEMLPGNGTIILDTVWFINLSIKSSVKSDSSSSIQSATNRMYQSVARLIKLCDDVLIDSKSSELHVENVNEIVAQVEDAVRNLVELAQEKIAKEAAYKTTPRSSYHTVGTEAQTQRNSLPDIPLTPREREILEQTSGVSSSIRNSHSTESILRDCSPPPKPPLPGREANLCLTPPPLPPKKKSLRTPFLDEPIDSSLEKLSFRSKSPEGSISLYSESAGSVDSMLNHSRDEEEIKALMDDGESSEVFTINGSTNCEESSLSSSNNSEHQTINDYHRLSNTDSGIMSVRSSYSKRSSQQSSVSSQFCSQFSKQNTDSLIQKNPSASVNTGNSSVVLPEGSGEYEEERINEDEPPAIPLKTKKKQERRLSPYDNVPDGELVVTCEKHQSHQSLSSSSISSSIQDGSQPPPLPPKKKHIMAYMEMFGNCSHTNDQEFMRHSIHVHYTQPTPSPGLPTTQSLSFTNTSQTASRSSHTQSLSIPSYSNYDQRIPSPLHSPNSTISTASSTPPALPPKQRSRKSSSKTPPQTPTSSTPDIKMTPSPAKVLPDLLEHTASISSTEEKEEACEPCNIDLMEELNVEQHLVLKKEDEEGPDIRGGPIDALIIQATKATKNGVFTYQEAFLTTYRTFISPYDLICKLIRRYNHFYYLPDKKPRSREAFALIVRVVGDLTSSELDEKLQLTLMNFVQQLIFSSELTLAKALRIKHLDRYEAKQLSQKFTNYVTTVSLNPRNFTLLDFKTEQIAEQMTLLDAELFMKIEIPEVLIWAQEQNEERSPNLTRFTEHFNKMSYWARTKILTAESKEIREKYFSKFIKIMKHLRKINNFNSYLALLSALDSAPVRRLEWQKHGQEGLKEYCALIDSSSSFRAYRQALAETQPPCIPYIGLVLQDLTFVHIGNSNLLPDGMINFSKRWQQFNIVENMKKFKKSSYQFKKNESIIQFFQNFDEFIGEDAMWQLSEKIKPRGCKKATQ